MPKATELHCAGSKTAEYEMVDYSSRRCCYDRYARRPDFNAMGCKMGAYCEQHANDGMVNIFSGRCSHASRTKQPSSNLERNTTAIYGKHIADGMVNVHRRRCLHSSCTKPSTFNVEGRKTVAFCRHYELWTAWWTLRKGLLKQLLP